MPKISICIPSFNHQKYICETIKSVLNQSFQDFEIIITDDGSTDGTIDKIKEFNDPRIRLFCFEKNQGAAYAVNNCLVNSSGDFIAPLNSDDIFMPTKLEKQIRVLEEHPEIGAVFSYAEIINDDGNEYLDTDHFYCHIFQQPNRTRYEWLNYFFYHGNCLCHPSALIRRELFFPPDSRLAQFGDFNRWIKICLKSEIWILPENLVKFRVRTGNSNTSGGKPEARIRMAWEQTQILRNYLSIRSGEEISRIFPSLALHNTEVEPSLISFFIAQLALKVHSASYHLFALETLNDLLDQKETAALLATKYDFRYIDFINLAGKYDFFKTASVTSQVFINTGKGYNEKEKVEQYIGLDSIFTLTFDLSKFSAISSIRWDPVMDLFCAVKLHSIEYQMKTGEKRLLDLSRLKTNGRWNQDGFCHFDTFEPMFFLPLKGGVANLTITGELVSTSLKEVENRLLMGTDTVLELFGKVKERIVYKLKACLNVRILRDRLFPAGSQKRDLVKYIAKGKFKFIPNLIWKVLKDYFNRWELPVLYIGREPLYYLDTIGSGKIVQDKSTLDISLNNEPLVFYGWAVDRIAEDVSGGVYIILDGKKYKAEYGIERIDVARIYNNLSYQYSGFKLSLSADVFTKGKHTMHLRIMTKNRKAFYRSTREIALNIIDAERAPIFLKNQDESFQNEQAADFKVIAFYLPQYHPIPENDRWWGKGFTEWTNVTRAVPQFIGHYQPHLPADLGFYDLRVPETREEQANLAKEYGIYGFCYHYYWFGGKKLLQRPIEDVLKSQKPEFPFCICWANENWTRKWDGAENDILISQSHSSEDDLSFINEIIPFFLDERYIRVNGKPLFIVYRVDLLPSPIRTVEIWRRQCLNLGIGEIFLCAAQSFGITDPRPYGFDAAVEFPPHGILCKDFTSRIDNINSGFQGHVFNYNDYYLESKKRMSIDTNYTLFRTVMPSWDNTARKKNKGSIYIDGTPEVYKTWLEKACEYTQKDLAEKERFVFINAWNEWAEGCHLEPDQKYGHAYLKATKEVLEKYQSGPVIKSGSSLKELPLVSVVIPSYNHEFYIKEALNSVLNQSYSRIEIILIDDGSTDNTVQAALEVLKHSNMKTLVFTQPNEGAHAAINFGISKATGKYISILNSDDAYHPERIATLVQCLEKSPSTLAFSKVKYIDSLSRDISETHKTAAHFLKKQNESGNYPSLGFALLDSNVAISTGNLFFEKKLFEMTGPFDNLQYCHDWDFLLTSLRFNEPVYIDQELYYYRFHKRNSYLRYQKKANQEVKSVLTKYFLFANNQIAMNPMFPCNGNWDNYFHMFIKERGYSRFFVD